MKYKLSDANKLAIVLLLLSIIETVVFALCSVLPWYSILMEQVFNIIGIVLACYSYSLAMFSNRRHSFWNRENSDNIDETPSGCAVVVVKLSGYLILLSVAVLYLIQGILQGR